MVENPKIPGIQPKYVESVLSRLDFYVRWSNSADNTLPSLFCAVPDNLLSQLYCTCSPRWMSMGTFNSFEFMGFDKQSYFMIHKLRPMKFSPYEILYTKPNPLCFLRYVSYMQEKTASDQNRLAGSISTFQGVMESFDRFFCKWLLQQVLWMFDWVSDFGYELTATWIRYWASRTTASQFDLKFLHKNLINSEWTFWDPWYCI